MSKFNGFDFYDKKQVVLTNGIPSSYVNAASETKITSVYVPANTFAAGDILHIEWQYRLTGSTSGSSVTRLYWSETDDIITSPIQLTNIPTSSVPNTNVFWAQNRRLSIIVANGSGNGSKIYGANNTLQSDFASATFVLSTVALNWTVDSYIILAGFCGTGTGIRTEFLKVSN
jgi:hypothetical protein